MSSFSQSSLSRRSLLRLGLGVSAVAGSAALLSACGSGGSSRQSGSQGGNLNGSKSSTNPNGYSDDGQNYSGLVEYTHYEGTLSYEQGAVEHPPRNAPKPKVTDALSVNTVTGFHEAIAYFAAAMDYLVKTGSTDAFSIGGGCPVGFYSCGCGEGVLVCESVGFLCAFECAAVHYE